MAAHTMSKRGLTVQELADEAETDVDVVLVTLWGAGLEYVDAPESRIYRKHVADAQKAVGVGGQRQRRVSYWLDEFGLEKHELTQLLSTLGYRLEPTARSLPKGSIRRLRKVVLDRRSPVSQDLEQRREGRRSSELRRATAFEWTAKGLEKACEFLTAEEVSHIHLQLESDFAEADDPIFPPGVKDPGLLESAVSRPQTSLGGTLKYSTVQSAGAALLHSLVHNHPFHNGNKRTALVSLLVFLDRNGFVLESSEDELYRWMLQVAAHGVLEDGYSYDYMADREVSVIADWIIKRSRQSDKSERPITWRNLRTVLRQFGCEIVTARGDRVEIKRIVDRGHNFFGFRREVALQSVFHNTGDGREVPRSVLKRIRQELELDSEHGVDSDHFYVQQQEPDFFIAQYSKLLRRLARV
ncbi:type II toxin-antitoxin system death-on-curing family toxin [Sinomonas atrocyanea]|uniref:type II toxin-antitoxin system death-on-curing family toxin n=1 Tax=Sinomonas atrocyanea TaxID=37927 RepID=UPI0028545806|nr:type II toxin-antitoxin system death-on-curing family toxin [Sinomonas atrocyanea]MDR6621080.1 death-on-curing family protein [Sinomonas atrocyanea]